MEHHTKASLANHVVHLILVQSIGGRDFYQWDSKQKVCSLSETHTVK